MVRKHLGEGFVGGAKWLLPDLVSFDLESIVTHTVCFTGSETVRTDWYAEVEPRAPLLIMSKGVA
ncbi:hypothetical protein IE4771_PD00581 (plasmid) [Rhizobium etli bv. mimosae str. IE4771]|uniref:Uncharacterized protein n=1 Tax=Rhizobium etli bv. mimosae str. IE4771 TaxID=1432050 RepID=A0A060IGT1_RHIET|nr:hypothetical protein IE4771_PD00581 [Rhizobium sp. IE4771]